LKALDVTECCLCTGCFSIGYSADVEIPGDGAESGYRMTNGYSGEYVVPSAVANGVDVGQQYHNGMSHNDAPAMLTYPNHYAPAPAMITTVPYCSPLVTDPYIVQHAGVTYPHQVISLRHFASLRLILK